MSRRELLIRTLGLVDSDSLFENNDNQDNNEDYSQQYNADEDRVDFESLYDQSEHNMNPLLFPSYLPNVSHLILANQFKNLYTILSTEWSFQYHAPCDGHLRQLASHIRYCQTRDFLFFRFSLTDATRRTVVVTLDIPVIVVVNTLDISNPIYRFIPVDPITPNESVVEYLKRQMCRFDVTMKPNSSVNGSNNDNGSGVDNENNIEEDICYVPILDETCNVNANNDSVEALADLPVVNTFSLESLADGEGFEIGQVLPPELVESYDASNLIVTNDNDEIAQQQTTNNNDNYDDTPPISNYTYTEECLLHLQKQQILFQATINTVLRAEVTTDEQSALFTQFACEDVVGDAMAGHASGGVITNYFRPIFVKLDESNASQIQNQFDYCASRMRSFADQTCTEAVELQQRITGYLTMFNIHKERAAARGLDIPQIEHEQLMLVMNDFRGVEHGAPISQMLLQQQGLNPLYMRLLRLRAPAMFGIAGTWTYDPESERFFLSNIKIAHNETNLLNLRWMRMIAEKLRVNTARALGVPRRVTAHNNDTLAVYLGECNINTNDNNNNNTNAFDSMC